MEVDVWKTVAMGVIEGLTEFLPISSTGHMILLEGPIGFPKELAKTFDIFIQLGAILAVVVVYRARLARWVASFDVRAPIEHPITKVLVAFVPAAIMGLLFHKKIQFHLFKPVPVAAALIAGAIAIEVILKVRPRPTTDSVEQVTMRQAAVIGLVQCVALWPGMSRSAATIMGGLAVGLGLEAATEFSFFLAIPTMVAASGYSLWKVRESLTMDQAGHLALGFVVAFAVALWVIKGFLKIVQRGGFRPFVVYRIALGLLVLAVLAR